MDCRNSLKLLLFLTTLVALIRAQDLSIPLDWRKPNSTRPRSERLTIAQTAVQSLLPSINSSDGTSPSMNPWASANVPTAFAQCDYIAGTQANHDLVSKTVQAFRSAHASLFDNTQTLVEVTSDALMWGLAAFYGARAYNDTNLRSLAIDVWNVADKYAVSVQDAANGTQPSRNISFSTDCIVSGFNTAGGVFWQSAIPNDCVSNGQTVGAYVALSAHLWESTGNVTYLNAANLSATFMYTHMYLQSDQVMIDNYNLADCSDSANSDVWWTYNQGFFLEGIAILSSAPISGNVSWANIVQSFVVSTIKSPLWTQASGSNAGILIENSTGNPELFAEAFVRRNAFFRALYETWSRANSFSAMAKFIQAFMMVQYNALLDLASNNDSIYSPDWLGPTVTTSVPWGQLAASEVLNAAIAMPPTNSSSSSSSATPTTTFSSAATSSPSGMSSRKLSSGAIIGIAVGATVVASGIIVGSAAWLIRRRKRSKVQNGARIVMHDVDVFPPGLPIIQQPIEEPPSTTEYSSKTRYRPGLAMVSSSSLSTPVTIVPAASTTDGSADPQIPTLGGDQEVEIRRLVEQLMDSMHQLNGPPPSYFSGPD